MGFPLASACRSIPVDDSPSRSPIGLPRMAIFLTEWPNDGIAESRRILKAIHS